MNSKEPVEIAAALRALAAETEGRQAPPAVEQALVEAFRARGVRKRAPLISWPVRIAAAAALAAAIVLWWELPREQRKIAVRQEPIAPAAAPAPPPAPRAIATTVRRPVARPRRRAPAPAPEIATEFVPLRVGVPLAEDEFAQIVRISIERAEMLRFGFPVPAESRTQRIKADVLVGHDGVAHAVRFVR